MAGNILTPEGIIKSGLIRIVDGKIQSVAARGSYTGKIDIDAGDNLIAPGFIDIHVHGGVNEHFMTSDRDGIVKALRFHMQYGTTGLLATTTTASSDTIIDALITLKEVIEAQAGDHGIALGAKILGVHIEGPYLNPLRAGAMNKENLSKPDLEEYKEWEKQGAPVRMLTIAPELPGAEELICYIRDHSQVLISAGHTDATYEEMTASLDWGITHCTHFTNAMSGFTENEPGVFSPGTFAAGLIHRSMTVEMIADGIHVHPRILELIYRVKGADHVALITDAVPFCGLPEGIYTKGPKDKRKVVVGNGTVRIHETGVLAGSALTMNRAAQQMAGLGIPLTDVWKMAAAVPARLSGFEGRKGEIKPGLDADLIIVNNHFDVLSTMISGHVTHWSKDFATVGK